MMKKEKYILFTAGRGPVECSLAVQGIQSRFKKYLSCKQINFEIVSQHKGNLPKSMETIVFKVNSSDTTIFDPWIGTIQWICKSPVRKFHKRKNWFIKCQEIFMPPPLRFNKEDVAIQSYRDSGPGGQHRNKVETAIRIIHKPTGIIVTAADSRSQAVNKKKAWQKLEHKLNLKNQSLQEAFDTVQWTTQLDIERGNPVRTFEGLKFKG